MRVVFNLNSKDLRKIDMVLQDIRVKVDEGSDLSANDIGLAVKAKAQQLAPKDTTRLMRHIKYFRARGRRKESRVISTNPTKNYPPGYRGEANRGDGFNLALWFATNPGAVARTGSAKYMRKSADYGRSIAPGVVRQSLNKVFVKNKKV